VRVGLSKKLFTISYPHNFYGLIRDSSARHSPVSQFNNDIFLPVISNDDGSIKQSIRTVFDGDNVLYIICSFHPLTHQNQHEVDRLTCC